MPVTLPVTINETEKTEQFGVCHNVAPKQSGGDNAKYMLPFSPKSLSPWISSFNVCICMFCLIFVFGLITVDLTGK